MLFENLNKINTPLQDIKVRGKSKQLWEWNGAQLCTEAVESEKKWDYHLKNHANNFKNHTKYINSLENKNHGHWLKSKWFYSHEGHGFKSTNISSKKRPVTDSSVNYELYKLLQDK